MQTFWMQHIMHISICNALQDVDSANARHWSTLIPHPLCQSTAATVVTAEFAEISLHPLCQFTAVNVVTASPIVGKSTGATAGPRTKIHCCHCKCKCIFWIQHIMHISLQPIQSIHWCHCNPRTRIHCCHCWSQSWQKYPSAIISELESTAFTANANAYLGYNILCTYSLSNYANPLQSQN